MLQPAAACPCKPPMRPRKGADVGVACAQIQLTDARSSMSRGLPSFEVKKLSTIMRELGHEWVDVLKIDIEGNEWPVLEGMINDKTPMMFTQMQVLVLPSKCSIGTTLMLYRLCGTHVPW